MDLHETRTQLIFDTSDFVEATNDIIMGGRVLETMTELEYWEATHHDDGDADDELRG